MAAENQANVLTIIEHTETNLRGIVLRGRSLPFEGVSWGTELNVDINYFPGNPVAIAQVVGSQWTDTTMNGRWSDRFLIADENAPNIIGFPDLAAEQLPEPDPGPEIRFPTIPTFLNPPSEPTTESGGVVPAARARTARAVRDALYQLSRGGQLLKVEWGSIARFGYLAEFTPTHDREQDIHWEMRFAWIGDTDAQPKPQPRSKDLVSTLKLVLQFYEDLITFLRSATLFVETYKRKLTQFLRRMDSLASDLVSTLERLVRVTTPVTPNNLWGNTKSSLQGMRSAIADFLSTFRETGAKIRRMADTRGQDPAGGVIIDGMQREFRALAARLAASATREQATIDRFATPNIKAVVRPYAGISLRDVSIDQYGTPNNWRAIQEFNGFPDSVVPAGAIVRVPDIPSNPPIERRTQGTARVNSLNVAGVL